MEDVLRQEWNIPRSKVSVIPNGFSPDEVEQYADTDPVDGRVGFIGTLHPKLNIGAFIKMAKRSEVDSVVVIGDGMLYDELKFSIEKEGVGDKVRLTGRLPGDEAYELLATSEVFVYPIDPSEHARMLSGVKIYDYAALERPMVLDDVSESDVWARLDSENAALFANPYDTTDFVDKVCNLLNNKSRRDEIAANAQALVDDYQWEKQVEKIKNEYLITLDSRGGL
jgi:glycosyltransferase involved in cell wall biosynthesis